MFDLEKEVRAWSGAALAGRCRPDAMAAELADHLYCEIETARRRGASDEKAFAEAVAKVGSPDELAAELSKTRSLLGKGCAAVARLDRSGTAGRRLLVAHGILWAMMTIAGAVLAKENGKSASEAFEWMLLLVVIPGWIGSEQILRRALRVCATPGA